MMTFTGVHSEPMSNIHVFETKNELFGVDLDES